MSHKASSWLAEIPARELSGSQFRVLFHLCDAHNSKRDPATACFPSQERLREATGLSNGGLNNALNALEEGGFIQRVRRTQPGAAIQRTYYILGCDFAPPQEQTPESGVGANSIFREANSTFQGSKLHLSGEYPVSNQKKEPPCARDEGRQPTSDRRKHPPSQGQRRAERLKIAENSDARFAGGAPDAETRLRLLAEWINSGKHVPTSMITNTKRDELLAAGLVTPERLRQLQIY